MNLLIICVALLIPLMLVAWFNNYTPKEKRLEIEKLFNELIVLVENANKAIENYTSFSSGYFNHKKERDWMHISAPVKNSLDSIALKKIRLKPGQKNEIEKFKKYYQEITKIRSVYNENYVNHELKENKLFFDNIEGRALDEQQRKSIVVDEDNNLVVAGAGSGKTTTIAGKVSYLIKRHGVSPKDIILISFTKKASDEMRDRISKKMKIDIDVMTFHKLGLDTIAKRSVKPSIFDEGKTQSLLNSIFAQLLRNEEYNKAAVLFLTQYLKPINEETEKFDKEKYIQFMKDQNFRALKQIEIGVGNKTTMMNQICKSIDEVMIANYLFIHGIDYEYERVYEHDTSTKKHSQYKPDFFLPRYGIYIEHWGVDRKGNIPDWFEGRDGMSATKSYKASMSWKRTLHSEKKTRLIETYHYELREGTLFASLESQLKKNGVTVKQRTAQEIIEILKKSANDDLKGFFELVGTFLSLYKSNNHGFAKLKKEVGLGIGEHNKLRKKLFLKLFEPIFLRYEEAIKPEIDFSDMINTATAIVNRARNELNYKYIIIDEFQDISFGRYYLIKALLEKSPGCKTFCVGDDWQSIYRFAGSDISLFSQFEKHFGTTSLSRIETTYRFNSKLIKLSSDFILKNPNQIKKSLKPFSKDDSDPLRLIYTDSISNDTNALVDALEAIKTLIGNDRKNPTIMILSRYNHNFRIIEEDTANFKVQMKDGKSNCVVYKGLPEIKIDCLTVHRSKGLEADYVIVFNCNSGQWGFPSEKSDDPILNMVLTQADRFENGEERRLFYVALTRCRKKVFILTKNAYKSKFVVEIEKEQNLSKGTFCPVCKNGRIVAYSGVTRDRAWTRYTCSNENWGCGYLKWAN